MANNCISCKWCLFCTLVLIASENPWQVGYGESSINWEWVLSDAPNKAAAKKNSFPSAELQSLLNKIWFWKDVTKTLSFKRQRDAPLKRTVCYFLKFSLELFRCLKQWPIRRLRLDVRSIALTVEVSIR